ncbi:MAG TPA: D-aminoacyl-tRNA deacylase [Thermoplasmata archaeon]|nr:D-aminoacyl-tRNA deacylase [Thermoplasmata archaeon]
MRYLVASEADEASRHQASELLKIASWDREEPFEGKAAWRLRDTVLITIAGIHLDRDHLDRDLETTYGERVELIVYLSKHRSESARPSLTVHPIGNPTAAELGGQPRTLVPSAPRFMTAALRALKKAAANPPYEVTFEATHHGPYLTAPTFYIEQGSTEREWADLRASKAIAQVLVALEPTDGPIAVGLGGGHYVPRHTDLALARRIAFGHLLPAYALEKANIDIVDQAVERTDGATLAYVHRKTIRKPDIRILEERLEHLGLRVVRESELEENRGDETR